MSGTTTPNIQNTDTTDSIKSLNADTLFQIFTDSNVVIILWFLAVYFVIYLLLNIFRGKDGARSSISKWIDIVALVFLLIYLGGTYFGKSESEKKQVISDLYSKIKEYLDNPLSLISVGFFIFTLYVVIYILELPMDLAGKPITITIIENAAWIFFVVIIFSSSLKYITDVSLTNTFDNVGNYLSDKAKTATTVTLGNVTSIKGNAYVSSTPVPLELNEVFNVGNNMFTYDDAQSVCASYGARLATYDEIESTYNNGGEWCNYGWSDGQEAYFPTQKSTWQKLQKSESTKHSCGRPGVNGGYIDDPEVRLGVNCYGKKPKPSASELSAISSGVNIPKTPEDALLEKKIDFWKQNREKLLKINSYNTDKWSMY
jgi:hypothetical protein